jgi:hypothetical protein
MLHAYLGTLFCVAWLHAARQILNLVVVMIGDTDTSIEVKSPSNIIISSVFSSYQLGYFQLQCKLEKLGL